MASITEQVVKKTTKKVIKELNAIGKSISSEGVGRGLRNIANEAVGVAKDKLMNADPRLSSQQITPQEAAAEIQAVYNESDKSVIVVASLDYSKRNAMYFLEYGAGISSENAIHRSDAWVYKIRHPDNTHERIDYKEAVSRYYTKLDSGREIMFEYGATGYDIQLEQRYAKRVNYEYELWRYQIGARKTKPKNKEQIFETKQFTYKGQDYGVTISSQAIGYMRAAREHINQNASNRIAASIQTVIARRTNRPAPKRYKQLHFSEYIGHYEPTDHYKDIY